MKFYQGWPVPQPAIVRSGHEECRHGLVAPERERVRVGETADEAQPVDLVQSGEVRRGVGGQLRDVGGRYDTRIRELENRVREEALLVVSGPLVRADRSQLPLAGLGLLGAVLCGPNLSLEENDLVTELQA